MVAKYVRNGNTQSIAHTQSLRALVSETDASACKTKTYDRKKATNDLHHTTLHYPCQAGYAHHPRYFLFPKICLLHTKHVLRFEGFLWKESLTVKCLQETRNTLQIQPGRQNATLDLHGIPAWYRMVPFQGTAASTHFKCAPSLMKVMVLNVKRAMKSGFHFHQIFRSSVNRIDPLLLGFVHNFSRFSVIIQIAPVLTLDLVLMFRKQNKYASSA